MTKNGDARDVNPNGTQQADDAELPPIETSAETEALAALEAEKSDLKDRLMRALAETENVRRRAEREVKDARTYAIAGFARDMLNVADNIHRALDAARQGEQSPAAKALIEGVELTERDLVATLGRHGVKLLEPEGQKFDPNFHQAMFEVPTDEVPSGTVVQVVQAGYAIGDRVLRPAMVGVAKGSGKAAEPKSA
jgi:molecular chaperone GrpE